MASDLVAPSTENHFQIKVDNTQMRQHITGLRLSFVRSVRASIDQKKTLINVVKEELANTTHQGGPNGQVLALALPLTSPHEVKEKHIFNTTDGSSKYGSILAPTYHGRNIIISYEYELRIWHKASLGSDDLTLISMPVTVAC